MSFDELMKTWKWSPIRNCPGRYVLQDREPTLRPQDLLKGDVEVSEFQTSAARDTVLIVRLDEGGLISYKRKDGSFVHTLNTPEGFERKLAQLGIQKPEGTH